MEIDRMKTVRCFGCNKIGHIRPDCPEADSKKTINVRELLIQFTEQEREDLLLEARADELRQSAGDDEDNDTNVRNFL